jgi:hypothetical protein
VSTKVQTFGGRQVAVISALVVAGILGIILLVQFLGGWAGTPVDKIGLHYSGGPIEGQKFQEVIEPGSGQRFLGLADKLVLLPITQRDYIVSLNPEESDRQSSDVINAPAKGGVEMQFEVSAYFTLNTEPQTIRRFYERICVKFQCQTEDGWDRMINNNFRKPIEQAIQQSIRRYTVNELYAGEVGEGSTGTTDEEAESLLVSIQTQIATDLKENVNEILGGQYFCGPTFDRERPEECPDFQFQIVSATPTSEAVRDAFAENAASRQEQVTAQNRADAAVAEAQGRQLAQEALRGIYTDPNYIAYLNALALQDCAKNSNCTLVVSPNGTNVNVQPRPAG